MVGGEGNGPKQLTSVGTTRPRDHGKMPHRIYGPICSCHGDRQEVLLAICPTCGTQQAFVRWGLSTVERIGLLVRKTGLPPLGPRPLGLPRLSEDCEDCDGIGIVDVGGGRNWKDCPTCDGAGGFPLLSDNELTFVRRRMRERVTEGRTYPEGQPESAPERRENAGEGASAPELPLGTVSMPETLMADATVALQDLLRAIEDTGRTVELTEPPYQGDHLVLRSVLHVDGRRVPLYYHARQSQWRRAGLYASQDLVPRESATPSASRHSTDPWAHVRPPALAAELDRGLVELGKGNVQGRLFAPASDPTIRAALTAVVDADAAEAEYGDEPWWYHFTPMDILDRLPGVTARPVITCWVSDSMASGEWSLNELRVGNRGYLFYVPDFGIGDREDLPLLGAWEPVDDAGLRRACLLDIYLKYWQDCGFPPSIGQWAKGDVEILLGGMEAALEQCPEAWDQVGEWIDTYVGSRITLEGEDVQLIAQMAGQPLEHVEDVVDALGPGWPGGPPPREDAQVVIGLVAHCLGKGPY